MEPKTVLLLDDQSEVLVLAKGLIDHKGYYCLVCDRSNDAIDIVKNFNLHAVVVDLHLAPSDCSGFEFAKKIRQLGYSGNIALMSGYLYKNESKLYLEVVDKVIEKPFDLMELVSWLDSF